MTQLLEGNRILESIDSPSNRKVDLDKVQK